MRAPVRALVQTLSPIFVVDGYVRQRRPDRDSDLESNGYVAVLNEERRTIAEWPSVGLVALQDAVRPALVEFTVHGGILRIDGKSTGVATDAHPHLRAGGNYARPR